MIIILRSANDRYILLNVDIRSDPNIWIVGVRIIFAIQRIIEISKYNRVFISFHTIVNLLDRFFKSGKSIIFIKTTIYRIDCNGNGFQIVAVGFGSKGGSFDEAGTVFQIPVAVCAGGVGGGCNVGAGQVGNGLNKRFAFIGLGGIAAVDQDVRIIGKVFPDCLPVGGVEGGGIDPFPVQRDVALIAVGDDVDGGIFRIGMSVEIVVDGIEGIGSCGELQDFHVVAEPCDDGIRIGNRGVQHNKDPFGSFGCSFRNGGIEERNRVGPGVRFGIGCGIAVGIRVSGVVGIVAARHFRRNRHLCQTFQLCTFAFCTVCRACFACACGIVVRLIGSCGFGSLDHCTGFKKHPFFQLEVFDLHTLVPFVFCYILFFCSSSIPFSAARSSRFFAFSHSRVIAGRYFSRIRTVPASISKTFP